MTFNSAPKDPLTGNADPAGFVSDSTDFGKGDPTPKAVALGYTEVEWTYIGVTQPETNGLVPHTIALSHPFNGDRQVTIFGNESLESVGFGWDIFYDLDVVG